MGKPSVHLSRSRAHAPQSDDPGLSILGIMLGESIPNVVDIDESVAGRHPGVGIGSTGVGALLNPHRLHTFGHDDAGNLLQIAKELLEPELKVESVPQDELGILRPQDIAGCRLIVVNLRTRLGDRLDDGRVARHVLCHVGDDREGGDDLELALCGMGGRCSSEDQRCEAEQQGSKLHRYLLGDRMVMICNCKLFAISLSIDRDRLANGRTQPRKVLHSTHPRSVCLVASSRASSSRGLELNNPSARPGSPLPSRTSTIPS
jgi:hypothetical protein